MPSVTSSKRRVAGAVLGALSLVGCGGRGVFPWTQDTDAWTTDTSTLPSDLQARIEGCVLRDDILLRGGMDVVDDASLRAAQAAYAAGELDIAISASGCTHLTREKQGDTVVSETLVTSPFLFGQSASGAPLFSAAVTRWVYDARGVTQTTDADGDGFFEFERRTTYDERAVTEVRERASGALLSRRTVVAGDEGRTLTVSDEVAVDGVLGQGTSFVTSSFQTKCNPPQQSPTDLSPATEPANLNTRACTDAERNSALKAIGEAAWGGADCLRAAGRHSMAAAVQRAAVTLDVKIECSSDTSAGFEAANDKGYAYMFPGKGRLIFHDSFFDNGRSSSARASTVLHELSHFDDVHDKFLEAAASLQQLTLTDPVYACEAMCYADDASLCTAAACLGKTVSNYKWGLPCSGTLDRDAVARVEVARGKPLAACDSGQQVGALCRLHNFGASVLFCDTETECNAKCQTFCESKSVSCENSCR
jgi:hypothetical protein